MSDNSKYLNFNPFEVMKENVQKKIGFVGVPIEITFESISILVNDFYKQQVNGISKNSFLVCVGANYLNDSSEIILLRVMEPIPLPHAQDLLSSKIEYYKEFAPGGELDFSEKMDPFTKNEFQYSGLECKVLGMYYRLNDRIIFGSDVENFYSAHNYICYKPTADLLTFLLNYISNENSLLNEDSLKNYSRIGKLRYSSTNKFSSFLEEVPIYLNVNDLIDRRTAFFGMTRTGKSNTIKKIIDATTELSIQNDLKIGQIIFDINGEYAHPNKQDGIAIYEKYEHMCTRYSLLAKEKFLQMKINFYTNPQIGYDLSKYFISDETADYVKNFLAIDFNEIDKDDGDYKSKEVRRQRNIAALLCIFNKVGLQVPVGFTYKLNIRKELVDEISKKVGKAYDFSKNQSLDYINDFFENLWLYYNDLDFIKNYKKQKNKEWAGEDFKALLCVLTQKKEGSTSTNYSGFIKLRQRNFKNLHTPFADKPFEDEILSRLRNGEIVIVDLTEGEEFTRNMYSERIVKFIFNDSMKQFIDNKDYSDGFNTIQMYFEEAHNLFPKNGSNNDLSNIYNRLAKEGAKYHLGINYATQEPSSISPNILKNTQNWFVAHLNNTDETKEIKKYYDFCDFEYSILHSKDVGFIRMKTFSNDFVIPVQIDKFS